MHALAIESDSYKPSFNVINTHQHESLKSAKVIDLIKRRAEMKDRFYSIEVSNFGNLSLNFNDFTVAPLFTSVTWFKDNLEMANNIIEPSVQLIKAITSTPTLLHLTCYKLTERKLDKLLENNVSNFLVLRGDVVAPNQLLKHAVDLVRLIKQKNQHISLSVGGYPEVHPEAWSLESDIQFLKEKVDEGADFIITQTCFSSTKILQFMSKCRKAGINVPIIPGIFIPFSYNVLLSMCRLCKIIVPDEEFIMYKMLKDDNEAFKDLAVRNTIKILNDLFNSDEESVVGVHFFTLNNYELIKKVTNNFHFK